VCDALPDLQFRFAGDEHGVLILPERAENSGDNEISLVGSVKCWNSPFRIVIPRSTCTITIGYAKPMA